MVAGKPKGRDMGRGLFVKVEDTGRGFMVPIEGRTGLYLLAFPFHNPSSYEGFQFLGTPR